MSRQTARTVLMIEPTNFGFNLETSASNSYQNKPIGDEQSVQDAALREFKEFARQLRTLGVSVMVYSDVPNSETPDSIFPNNWFSTHADKRLFTYPMAVENRRKERRSDILSDLEKLGFQLSSFTENEKTESFLEGTGSMVFDHDNRQIYAALSPRTHASVLSEVAKALKYNVVSFSALGKSGELIYHTNVMMCIGKTFIAIGLDTVIEQDRSYLTDFLQQSGKEIILLSNEQVHNSFAGNMLQLENNKGESVLILSQTAFDSLTKDQRQTFERHNMHILPVSIPTIEHIGGGSARCMLAEIFI